MNALGPPGAFFYARSVTFNDGGGGFLVGFWWVSGGFRFALPTLPAKLNSCEDLSLCGIYAKMVW